MRRLFFFMTTLSNLDNQFQQNIDIGQQLQTFNIFNTME